MPAIVMKPWSEIKPYDRNPRKNDDAVDAVANSIREFGFKQPIVVDRDLVIIAGHTRWKAAAKLKLKEVPVIIAEDLSEEQANAYRIADNSTGELAEWDLDLLSNELENISYDMADFGLDFIQVGETDPDDVEEVDVPDVPEETTAERGQIYRLGDHFLMCGDSTDPEDVKRLMAGGEADMVVTDPPYNVDYAGKNEALSTLDKQNRITREIENDKMSSDAFDEFLKKAYQNLSNSLKAGGAFYIWYAQNNTRNFYHAFEDTELEVHQALVWVKNNIVLSRSDYQWQHEPCIYGWKTGAGHYYVDDRSQHTVTEYPAENELKNKTPAELRQIIHDLLQAVPTDVLKEDKPQVSELHPTMKPVKLIARQIANSSRVGETVLDLFGGSGTTLMAAEQLGRKARLMEYDPHYVDVIIARWEEYTGKKAQLVNG